MLHQNALRIGEVPLPKAIEQFKDVSEEKEDAESQEAQSRMKIGVARLRKRRRV